MPPGATDQALEMRRIWSLFAIVGGVVGALVAGLIVWCVVRYRDRGVADSAWPVQTRKNDRLEILYTAIPLALVAGLFAIVYPVERDVEALRPGPAVRLDVTGYRWSWRFRYPELGVTVDGTPNAPPEFELPVGETTRLNVTSVDVDHSFWVPEFLFKRDAIPGLANQFEWTPRRTGSFRGQCGEFCGLQHALMTFVVRVVPRPEFDTWIASHRRPETRT